MKITLIAILLTSFAAQAQVGMGMPQNTNSMKYSAPTAAQGLRISLVKPILKAEFELQVAGASGKLKNSEDLKNTNGVALGYAYLPVLSPGVLVQASYLKVSAQNGGSDVEILRGEGNVALAFTSSFYGKLGVNIAKVSRKEYEKFESEIGGQAGLGVQFTQTFGAEVGYGIMRFKRTYREAGMPDVKSKTSLKGAEIALNATF